MSSRRFSLFRVLAVGFVLAAAVPVLATAADARAGAGSSFGSRGARTFSAPGFTRTAPMGAQPIQRSEASGGYGASGAASRRFGFGSGLAAGLIGAGLFGLLGGSLFGGLFKLLLIGALVVLALRFFRAAGGRFAGSAAFRTAPAFGGTAAGYAPRASGPAGVPPRIDPRDVDAFEAMLVDVQTAYGREDLAALGRLSTPEMLRRFERDLAANRRQGLHDDTGEARLLQGDLAEAWSEGPSHYATVAMRFSLRDLLVERASGRIVRGDPARPQEATELWTFRRDRGRPWLLSAIQQAR